MPPRPVVTMPTVVEEIFQVDQHADREELPNKNTWHVSWDVWKEEQRMERRRQNVEERRMREWLRKGGKRWDEEVRRMEEIRRVEEKRRREDENAVLHGIGLPGIAPGMDFFEFQVDL